MADWLVLILLLISVGSLCVAFIHYVVNKEDEEDKGDIWVPTQAEIHAQQHEAWDEQFEELLPLEERALPMAEILRLEADNDRKLALGYINSGEYNRVRSQLNAKAKERYARQEQGAIDPLHAGGRDKRKGIERNM